MRGGEDVYGPMYYKTLCKFNPNHMIVWPHIQPPNVERLCLFAMTTLVQSWHDSCSMMTSWNGSISRVTGPLCGDFTGHRWIPRRNASGADQRLHKRLRKQSWGWLSETPSCSLWRHCNSLGTCPSTTVDFCDNSRTILRLTKKLWRVRMLVWFWI